MRNGQHQHHNKRMRGRNNNNNNNNNSSSNNNNRRSHNPLTRVYESNGPDVKIRGTANHVAEKYIQLARDAQTSGDHVSAENYYQHAEHYFRMIAIAQEQFRQQNPGFQPPRPEGDQVTPRNADNFDENDDDGQQFGNEAPFGTREPQPYIPRDAQPFVQRDPQPYQPRENQQRDGNARENQQRDGNVRDNQPREGNVRENQPHEARQPQPQPARAPQPQPQPQAEAALVAGLPAFITGGAPQVPPQANGENGFDPNQPDRFPLHRRRRRHRGPRIDGAPGTGGPDDTAP